MSQELEQELKMLIIEALALEDVSAADIVSDAPLFGDGGLGLDRVIAGFPAVISPTVAGRYVYNRAILEDGWGRRHPLEAYTWVEAHLFLPLILRQP